MQQLSAALIPPTYRSAVGLIAAPIKVLVTHDAQLMRLLINLHLGAAELYSNL